jgi:hypothetical protein
VRTHESKNKNKKNCVLQSAFRRRRTKAKKEKSFHSTKQTTFWNSERTTPADVSPPTKKKLSKLLSLRVGEKMKKTRG